LYRSYDELARSSSDPNFDKLPLYIKALNIATELSYFEPTNLSYKDETVKVNEIVGRLHKDRGDYNQSSNHYNAAMDILNKEEEKIPASDNKKLEYRKADIYEDIGDSHAAPTDFSAAKIFLRKCSLRSTINCRKKTISAI
jgi:tetratricopeptide (TPR) repeat protein